MSDLAMDDLPEEWQEIAKQDGLRAVTELLNQTPATQADVVRIERRQERLTKEIESHERSIFGDVVWNNGILLGGNDRIGENSRKIEDLRQEQIRQKIQAKTRSEFPASLSILGLILSIIATGLAIYAITT